MFLYKRVHVRRVCLSIFIILSATTILSSFLHISGFSSVPIKASRGEINPSIDDINTVSKRTISAFMDQSQISELKSYCTVHSSAYKYLIQPDVPTNYTDWTYKRIRKCPQIELPNNLKNVKRVKYSLYCYNNKAKLVPSFTNSSSDIQIVELKNSCLATFIESCCTDYRKTPNVVHYVWYFYKEMDFYMFLNMVSVIRFVRPCLILFHGEFLPYGKYWDYIISIYPNILHIKRPKPQIIFGKKVYYHQHFGDLMRLEAVKSLGGMYLDTDSIVLRDLEPLRVYDMTLCYQVKECLHNSFIMATKNATFLSLWMEGYRKDYRNNDYVYNSMQYSLVLARNRKDLIHVENGTLCAPRELTDYRRVTNPNTFYNWSSLYGFHMYARALQVPSSMDVNFIRNFRTILGSMARHIVYGNKEICE